MGVWGITMRHGLLIGVIIVIVAVLEIADVVANIFHKKWTRKGK